MSSCSMKSSAQRLENIDENGPANWPPLSCPAPETPTESMEFLARSWSLSAMELSKALSSTRVSLDNNLDRTPLSSVSIEAHDASSTTLDDSLASHQQVGNESSPLISPRDSEEMKEIFLLHQALHPEFLSSQQLLKNGQLYKSIMRGRTMGRWLKDQKERKKQEIRAHNAQLHAAVSVAGVAAAIAAITAVDTSSQEMENAQQKTSCKTSAAVASAAALVASHCIEIAEDMGADHNQILTVVNSAVNARTNGDIMTLTAGAATALRGAATLRARLQTGYGIALTEENGQAGKKIKHLSSIEHCLQRRRTSQTHKERSFTLEASFFQH